MWCKLTTNVDLTIKNEYQIQLQFDTHLGLHFHFLYSKTELLKKSLQYLIEDVNTISTKLINEIKNGEENSIKIEKLGKILKSITKGSEEVANRVDHYESESVLTKVPQLLKKDKLYELTNNEDKLVYRNKILECYSEEDGVLRLKYNISRTNAEELLGSLSELGYFNLTDNASATVKSTAKNLFSNIRR